MRLITYNSDIVNSDMSINTDDKAIVLFYLLIPDNEDPDWYIDFYSDASMLALRAMRNTYIHTHHPVFAMAVPYGSKLYRRIENGTTSLHPFTEYPQVVLYDSGMPVKYMNGYLSDESTITSHLASLSAL